MQAWPKLPAKAAYLAINNSKKRNALSLAVLEDLRDQLRRFNTSPVDGRVRILPPFQSDILDTLEKVQSKESSQEAVNEHAWLVDAAAWQQHRQGLPNVVVLRSEGPVFSAGHDLRELRQLCHEDVKRTFSLCAEVMSLIRRSPAPVIGAIHGLATAAGCQLALSTDLPIAKAETQFQLPGASLGLPCTSPSTAVSRRLGNSFTYRMLATADAIRADALPTGTIEVVANDTAFEERIQALAEQFAARYPSQPQALGKWAFWTQVGFRGGGGVGGSTGDGYEDAVSWAGRAMALHARGDDAREGMTAFSEKRKPVWRT